MTQCSKGAARNNMRLIKRYPNRKLYDTGQKQYVTLGDVAHMIRGGHEVQVLDHVSGEDLTAITLTQIIFEQEKRQSGFLPRSVLRGLVEAGGERLSTLRKALALPLGLAQQVEEEIDRRLKLLMQRGLLDEDEGARLRALLLDEDFSGVGDGGGALLPTPEASVEGALRRMGVPTRHDVEALNEQLDQLLKDADDLLARRGAG